ncbi:hypothetical protein IG193_00635 [Infirmifilum lucidum]|uniref:Uncharacterized protein n=1 Tax=Infirmifilum lucidum TaxID=2776706 RepID=A0A7L9FH09_9CREN|nr:hypothetical protein [Infirmifilum lucidum]QOJ79007.1 hypothetical protein IG193_00635 [Infirmifilum lucidum]
MTTGRKVKFNFPLFPSDRKLAVYTSKLSIRSSTQDRLVEVYLEFSQIKDVGGKYLVSPVADIADTLRILEEIRRDVSDDEINSVTTEFGLGSKHHVYFVYMFSDDLSGLVAVSFTVQRDSDKSSAVFFLFVPFEYAKQIFRLGFKIRSLRRRNVKLHVEVVRNNKNVTHEYHSDKAVVYLWRILPSHSEPYQTVYPFILSVPYESLSRILGGEFSGALNLYIVRDVLMQSLLGSWLILKDRDTSVQFEYIIPTPVVGRLLKLGKTPRPLNVFSSVTFSAATFVLRIDLSSFFDDIDGKISKMDPKAILKALAHSQAIRAFLTKGDQEADRKIFRLVPIAQRSLHMDISVGGEDFRLKYRYLKTRSLELFLYSLYEELKERPASSSKLSSENLLSMVKDIIEKKVMDELKTPLNSLELKYKRAETREKYLKIFVVFSLAELGLHAISHLLMHYIHDIFNVPLSKMREILVLEIPRSGSGISAEKLGIRKKNLVIDGYIYVVKSNSNTLKGYVLISIDDDFSFEKIKNSQAVKESFNMLDDTKLHLKDAKNVVERLLKYIGIDESGGNDPCYDLWKRHSGLYHRTMKVILENQREDVREIIQREILDAYEDAFGLHDPEKGEPYRQLYYPLSQFRRLIIKLARTANTGDNTRDLIGSMKIIANAIYMAYQPICFDGCYNCTMIKPRYCGTKNPLLGEWLTSKAAARLILRSYVQGGV